MSLREYQRKRNFRKTPEPRGSASRKLKAPKRRFVIQKHAASRLHYDFRLELDGALKSWAVPKGPSLDPAVKSLAVQVEDHPLEYADFEGTIPEGEYGGGTVMVWDHGDWEPEGDPREAYRRGRLKFELHGEKLRGTWNLVRMQGRDEDNVNWLLIKSHDKSARAGDGYGILDRKGKSVITGRTLQQIAGDADRVWNSNREPKAPPTGSKRASSRKSTAPAKSRSKPRQPRQRSASRKTAAPDPSALTGARSGPLPRDLTPELATLTAEIPDGEDWLHEIKFDGYRMLAFVENGDVRLMTRRGNDWTARFGATAESIRELGFQSAILDGELVAVNEEGVSDFQKLQNWLQRGQQDKLLYYVFDLPYLNGFDLRKSPLMERKELLARMILAHRPANDGSIRYSDHIRGEGPAVLSQACRKGLEGVISKRSDSPYESRRSRAWLKTKCQGRQEFVIGGFTRPRGTRTGFGALLLGYYRDGALVYCGKVGTGFTQQSLTDLTRRMRGIAVRESPFATPIPTGDRRGATWIRPELVAEVEFTEWTGDGMLRHPSFQGLREDKPARDVVREQGRGLNVAAESPSTKRKTKRSAPRSRGSSRPRTNGSGTADKQDADSSNVVAGVTLSNPERVLYPDQGVTKRELAQYYASIADWVLPHVVERPLTLVRCPQGRTGQCFYQKHWKDTLPDAVDQVAVKEKSASEMYVVIHDLAGLISLVQVNVLELHPWGSRVDKLEYPDRIVFDLDPGEGVAWSTMRDCAREVRDLLEELGLDSFVRTSGGKGLHVVVPLQRRNPWDEVDEFARRIAVGLSARHPDRYVANMRKALRKGKIFIDYLRNKRGATSIASYSTRSRPGAPVAAPLAWSELDRVESADAFHVGNIPQRLAKLKTDPWEHLDDARQSLTKAVLGKTGRLPER